MFAFFHKSQISGKLIQYLTYVHMYIHTYFPASMLHPLGSLCLEWSFNHICKSYSFQDQKDFSDYLWRDEVFPSLELPQHFICSSSQWKQQSHVSSGLAWSISLHPSSTAHSIPCLEHKWCYQCLLNEWLKFLHVPKSNKRGWIGKWPSLNWDLGISNSSDDGVTLRRQWIPCAPLSRPFRSRSAAEEMVVQWWSWGEGKESSNHHVLKQPFLSRKF